MQTDNVRKLAGAGYICAGISLLLLPPAFAVAALLVGLVVLNKGSTGHGVAIIVLAVTCGFTGMYFGSVVWLDRSSHQTGIDQYPSSAGGEQNPQAAPIIRPNQNSGISSSPRYAATEPPEVATLDTLLRFPKLYQHKRIQFAGWQYAMVLASKDVKIDNHHIPSDCVYILSFSGGIGCTEIVPRDLLTPFGAANEENIDLNCSVEAISPAGVTLTHCTLSPNDDWKMRKRELELEKGDTRPSTN